jgi:hypothetical protein
MTSFGSVPGVCLSLFVSSDLYDQTRNVQNKGVVSILPSLFFKGLTYFLKNIYIRYLIIGGTCPSALAQRG